MRYLKFVLSSILVLFIAAIVIWLGVFAIIFSLIAAPILAWWVRRKAFKSMSENIHQKDSPEPKAKASYKVIEAEYEIIEK